MSPYSHNMSEPEPHVGSFQERLAELVDQADMSQTAFAQEAGIDRSTLSQLMSAGNRRLPRVETLLALARSAGVSVDWLLGLSVDGPVRADIVKEEFAVSHHDLTPLDEALIGWYRDSVGMKIRYVPATLPDLLKTEAVIHHEVARYASIRPEQRIETAEAPGSSPARPDQTSTAATRCKRSKGLPVVTRSGARSTSTPGSNSST